MQCSNFWRHLCVHPDREVLPCCRFLSESEGPRLNPYDLEGTLNHSLLREFREAALRGEEIHGCRKCAQEERAGVRSARQSVNAKFPFKSEAGLDVQSDQIETLELFLGSLCNMKCRTCDPKRSSSWRSEYLKLGWAVDADPGQESYDYTDLVARLPSVREIKFVGGEPLLARAHADLLGAVSDQRAAETTLYYSTNVTIWPRAEVLEHWKRFKEVRIWLSIDGFGKVNDYVRYPSQWSDVDRIARKFMRLSPEAGNFKFAVKCTVNVYNIFSVAELERWFHEVRGGLDRPVDFQLNPLIKPEFLAISILPPHLKKEALNRLNLKSPAQNGLVKFLAGPERPELIERLASYTQALDTHRGQSVREIVPELAALVP